MSSLAEVLAWKFDNASGIRTRQKDPTDTSPNPQMEIFDWPSTLGERPIEEDISAWKLELDVVTSFTQLRTKRNKFLYDSDWTQGNDSQLSTEAKIAWADYRQTLRDLPAITVDPANPPWPTAPE